MAIKSSEGRESGFTGPDNEATLRWLESCIESARHGRSGGLMVLLDLVRAEIIFEIELESRRDGHPGGPEGENGAS